MRQAGVQAETPSWVSFGVSLHLQTKKRDSTRVEKQWMPEQTGFSLIPRPTHHLCDGLSLSRFAGQGSNPIKHKLLTPPPHTPKMVPNYGGSMVGSDRLDVPGNPSMGWGGGGGKGSKSKNSLGDHFVSQNNGLQGVRHPISCLGVCYANKPPKRRGVWHPRLCFI